MNHLVPDISAYTDILQALNSTEAYTVNSLNLSGEIQSSMRRTMLINLPTIFINLYLPPH